jgi:hypothetical protein
MEDGHLEEARESGPGDAFRPHVLLLGEAAGPLREALERRGFLATLCETLSAAIDAHDERPASAIVSVMVDLDRLADIVPALRAHRGIGRLPLVCGTDDPDLRVQLLLAGADVSLPAATAPGLVAAQVEALVKLASRTSSSDELDFRRPPRDLEGELAIPATTMLTVLGLERRTGIYEVVTAGSFAHLVMAEGKAISGGLDGEDAPPLDVIRAMIGWSSGTFGFTAHAMQVAADDAPRLQELCLEAARLEDERRARTTQARAPSSRPPPAWRRSSLWFKVPRAAHG